MTVITQSKGKSDIFDQEAHYRNSFDILKDFTFAVQPRRFLVCGFFSIYMLQTFILVSV